MKNLIAPLLTPHYSDKEIDRYLSFTTDASANALLLSAGAEVLSRYKDVPGACVPLNTAWGAFLRDGTSYPVHVAVGEMHIDGEQIYGNEMSEDDYRNTFENGTMNMDWDGHCWISFGDLIGDASIIRTGKSKLAHKTLQNLVLKKLYTVSGVFAARTTDLASIGLEYIPRYVLSNDEITAVFNGSETLLRD